MKLKDKRGFTLVEILAAVVILGILSVVAVVSVSNIIENAREEHYKTAEEQLQLAGQSYVQQNRNKLPKVIGQKTKISLKELKASNFIKDIKDYNDNSCSEEDSYVQIYKYSQNDYSYLAHLVCPDHSTEETSDAQTPEISADFTEDAKLKINIKGNSAATTKLISYSYAIYRVDTAEKEVKNSGSLSIKDYKKEKETTLDVSKYTPGNIKVVITATNIYGNSIKVEKKTTFGDEMPPECVILEEDTKPKAWTNENRIIKIGCNDGEYGSGCEKSEYTAVFDETKKEGTIEIKDKSGKTTTCTVSVYVDKTKPSCVSSGGSSSWTNGSITLTGACSDPDSGCKTEYKNISKTFNTEINSTSQTPGQVCDNAGNCKTCPANQTVKIDKTAPTTPTVILYKWSNNDTRPSSTSGLSTISNNTWSKLHIYTTASGSTDSTSGIDHYEYTTTGATANVTNTSGKTRSVEAQGTSTIKYRACDEAGNCSPYSSVNTIKIDKTAPTCNVTGGSATWINATSSTSSRTVTATCSDAHSGCKTGSFSKTYSSNINTTTAGANGNSQGGYVEDNAGNKTNCSANQTVKIDKTAPTCNVTGGNTAWINASSSTTKRTITATCSDTGGSGCSTTSFKKQYSSDINTTTAGALGNGQGGTVSDKAGNTAICAANQTVKIDKTTPTKPTVNIYQWKNNSTRPSSASGLSTIANNTWSGKNIYTTASGSTDATSGVDHYEYTTTGVTSNVTNSVSSYRSVEASGTSTVKYRACDTAGNCSGYTSVTIKVDKVAPTCTNSGGSSTWTNGSRTITGTCSDTLSGCQGNATKTINYQINSTTQSPGTVYDNVGNYTVCPSDRTVKIDKTAPTCTNSGGNTSWTGNSVTITGKCSDTGGSGCTGNATKTFSSSTSLTNQSPGTVYDNAGNSTVCSSDRTIRIDKAAPDVPEILYNLGGYYGTSYSLGTWATDDVHRRIRSSDDASGISHFEYQNASASASSCSGDADGTETLNGASGGISNNTYYQISYIPSSSNYACYRAVDNAGNKSAWTAVQKIKIDNTAPSVPTMKYTLNSYTGTTYTMGNWTNKTIYRQIKSSDSDSGIDHFEYKSSNASASSCSGVATGNETLANASSGISNNTFYQISVKVSWADYACFRAVDKAGNASEWTPTQKVMSDQTAPSIPTMKYTLNSYTGTTYTAGNWTNKTIYRQIKSSDSDSGIDHFEYKSSNASASSCSGVASGNETLANASSGISNNTFYQISTKVNWADYACFRAVDKVGNASEWTPTQKVMSDQTAPTLTINMRKLGYKTIDYSARESYTSVYTSGENYANGTIFAWPTVSDSGGSGITNNSTYVTCKTTGAENNRNSSDFYGGQGRNFVRKGTTTLTCTAKDKAGNTTTKTATIKNTHTHENGDYITVSKTYGGVTYPYTNYTVDTYAYGSISATTSRTWSIQTKNCYQKHGSHNLHGSKNAALIRCMICGQTYREINGDNTNAWWCPAQARALCSSDSSLCNVYG